MFLNDVSKKSLAEFSRKVRGSTVGMVLPHTEYITQNPKKFTPGVRPFKNVQKTIKVRRDQDSLQEMPLTSMPKYDPAYKGRNRGRKGSDSINTGYTGYPVKTYTSDRRGVYRREPNPPIESDISDNSGEYIRRMNAMDKTARDVGDQLTQWRNKQKKLQKSSKKKLAKTRRKNKRNKFSVTY